MSFLKAEWRKLAMFNYAVNPEVLKSYVPAGTELDFFDGKCYVSVVGFMFLKTKLLGLSIPFHRDFEEVNLRFYVKRIMDGEVRRGVVFIKEIVPKPAITFVANTVYKEHYETYRMDHEWTADSDKLSVDYRWQKQGVKNAISVVTTQQSHPMESGSEEEFIAEHYWGYSSNGKNTFEYEVRHEPWQVHPVLESKIDLKFDVVYGQDFAFLNHQTPDSVLLAEGSEISVEGKSKLF